MDVGQGLGEGVAREQRGVLELGFYPVEELGHERATVGVAMGPLGIPLQFLLSYLLYGCLRVCKMIFDVWQFGVWLLPYIRPLVQVIYLLALMKSAGKVLICLTSSKDQEITRLSLPWSDLFYHQSFIRLRNSFC